MSNILKVTTPTAGYDNSSSLRTGGGRTPDTSIQAPVAPEKVVKTDARSDAASQEPNAGLKFQYESNFDNFIRQMQEVPSTAQEFSKLVFEKFGTLAQSGLGADYAQKIADFFSMIQIQPEELLQMLKNQGNASVRFNGAFFSLLRQVMGQTNSIELKSGILNFLKHYTDMSEGSHIMEQIRQNIEAAGGKMFSQQKGQLSSLKEGILYQASPGSQEMDGNASLLKEKILPFLNTYISRTHDRGSLRDLSAMLSFLTARLENGSAPRVMEAFEQLMRYQGMQKAFQGLEPSTLLSVLGNTEFEKASRQQKWTKRFAELLEAGVSGAAGAEEKAVFKNLMQSILLNESVYMPLQHMMLPIQYDGRHMFSEMWVDPDAESDTRSEEESRTIQGLVKFDVQEVGFFDLFFVYKEGDVQLQLNCPTELDGDMEKIRTDISRILTENGLNAKELFVESGQASIPISEAFPKIFERKNSINVRI